MGLIGMVEEVSAEPLSGGVSSDIWLVRADDRRHRPEAAARATEGRRRLAGADRPRRVRGGLARLRRRRPCPARARACSATTRRPSRSRWSTSIPAQSPQLEDGAARRAASMPRSPAPSGRSSAASTRLAARPGARGASSTTRPLRVAAHRALPAAHGRRRPRGARAARRRSSPSLRATRIALVHGDVSPKNILVGDRPVFLDAECATWSDPAFDAAFCLTHLALKQFHLPDRAADLRAASRRVHRRLPRRRSTGKSSRMPRPASHGSSRR